MVKQINHISLNVCVVPVMEKYTNCSHSQGKRYSFLDVNQEKNILFEDMSHKKFSQNHSEP